MNKRDYGITFTLLVSAHIFARFIYEKFIIQSNLSSISNKMMPWIPFIILAVIGSAIFLGLIHFGICPAILWLADVRAKSRVKTFDSFKEEMRQEMLNYERRIYGLYNEQRMHIAGIAEHYTIMSGMANELSERISALDKKDKIKFSTGFSKIWVGESIGSIEERMKKIEERLVKLEER